MPAGTSSFTVRVADAAGQDDTQALSIVINLSRPAGYHDHHAPGRNSRASLQSDATSDGRHRVTDLDSLWWIAPSDAFPESGGVISGTPTNTGNANFTVTVTDTLNQSDTQSLSIAVSAALTITTNSLPDAEVDHSYSKMLQRSGGVAPFTWSVTPPLPDGLSLDPSTGEIAGTPAAGTEGTTHDLTFTVQDSSTPTSQTASKLLELKIKN